MPRINEYPWEKLLSEKQKTKINGIKNKLYNEPEQIRQILCFEGLNNFVNQFSPTYGVLGFLGFNIRKKRTRQDSIEFIAKTGLVNNDKEAEIFLDKIKNETFITSLPTYYPKSAYAYFELKEYKDSKGLTYKANFLGDARD